MPTAKFHAATLLFSSLALAGCGAGPVKTAPSQDDRPAAEIVQERAAARWNLLVSRDFEAAYDYLSAGTRTLKTREAYVAEMTPRPVTWTSAEVTKVDCPPQETFCSVLVKVGFQVKSPVRGVGSVGAHSGVEERWILSGGVWGYLPQEIVRQ